MREKERLAQHYSGQARWLLWGPYLSERQWGTVREDYSPAGDAWGYFSHDQARSRAYRWGEDGLAGISDERQLLCFSLALWNGRDTILKERLFGLTNAEGNHGEDVKEYYFYLDNTPSHAYMKYLYKYPQRAFPYADLVETSRRRSRHEPEYELWDTGVFADDRYFDVFVEYAKLDIEDILIRIRAFNRGPEPAELHLLPTLWFRNTWQTDPEVEKPELKGFPADSCIRARHPKLGEYRLYADQSPQLLFTENETNQQRLFGLPDQSHYRKDGIHELLVNGRDDCVNPDLAGTKASACYRALIEKDGIMEIRLRLMKADSVEVTDPFAGFEKTFEERIREADEFYAGLTPGALDAEHAMIIRQALSGMLWSKQFYNYDVDKWLAERGCDPLGPPQLRHLSPRNHRWFHMVNTDIISMPDKWEYPWYAAWDLAFHTIVLKMVDPEFAKSQLELMLRENYLHPNGQIPAYEWNFDDVNPPVHAWAVQFNYRSELSSTGKGDLEWLKHTYQKLLLNFTWWVNRKDPFGRNVFEGGFLGLDNIGVFDRSKPLPTSGVLEQADGTAWMALFCQNMLQLSLELAREDPVYEEMAIKFFEHFLWIGAAMDRIGENDDEMWDEADGFFYDLLRFHDGSASRLKVRSLVGLLPLCATTVIPPELLDDLNRLKRRARWFVKNRPELIANIHDPLQAGFEGRYMLSLLNESKLRRILARLLDEKEFLSPYGIRSISRVHEEEPYVFHANGQEFRVAYLPGESDSGMFGGNSNWRGPVWFPVNVLILRALIYNHMYFGGDFKIECPTGSGTYMNLYQVAAEISRRLTSIFLRNEEGKRPFFGGVEKFDNDPHWRDYLLFHEYFHADHGTGLGASHQTGWTGLVARLIQLFAAVDDKQALDDWQSFLIRIEHR
jgi:hypothetical protein